MHAMAKAGDPPFGRKPQDLQVEVCDGSRLVSDFPGIEYKRKRDELEHEENSRAGKASGVKRREEPRPNPIIEFIEKKLKLPDISGRAMVAALKAVAENGLADGSIMSDDRKAFVVMDNGKVKNRLAMTSVPATISRLRK
jgi:hypothetical protein